MQSAIKKIAVYRALFLGDLICSLPALESLKQRFPGAEIALIGLPWAEDFVRRVWAIDRLLAFPGYPGIAEVPYDPQRTATFLEQMRAERFDLAIQMHGDGTVSNGFVAELGARHTLGYCRDGDPRLDASLPYQDGEHETLRWLRLVQVAGDRLKVTGGILEHSDAATCNLQPVPPSFTVTPRDHAHARKLLSGLDLASGPLVALHPGAKDPGRRWPAEKFAALADALQRRCGARVLLTGGANERALTQDVARAARFPVLDLAGATDLGVFAALLSRIDLLVTNDTGASHLASITRTLSIVLFGPSRPAQWAPLDTVRHRVIDARAHVQLGTEPSEALRALPVALVLAACEDVFLSPKDERRRTNEQAVDAQRTADLLRERAVGAAE